jgi:hypothetical protein
MVAPEVVDAMKKANPAPPVAPPRKAPRQDGARSRRRRTAAPWVELELEGVDLGDERLDRRLSLILSDLAEQPAASIPAACGGKNETTAAYNFFDNDKADPRRILEPHYRRTKERVAAQPVAIFVPDTTEVDLTRPRQQVVGAGPLDEGTRFGALVHPLEAFSADGTPLGAIWAPMWTRDPAAPEDRPEPPRARKHLPIEEKESYRWLESVRRVGAVAQELPGTECIVVIDSEADIYEVLAEPRGRTNPIGWIVRACQDRAVTVEGDEAGAETARQLWAGVAQQQVLFTHEINIRAHQAKTECEQRKRRAQRAGRKATVEVRAARVTLRPPWRPGDRKLSPVAVNVVQVRETDPPAGESPVEWVLVTTLPVDTIEDVKRIITYYTVRWVIEVFFRVLKSGCRIERRRFEHVERALTFVAVSLIVAWRVLMVCRLGRSCPDLDCEAVFEPSEWKSVYVAVHRRAAPEEAPRLGEMIKLIAQLGGYVNTPGRKDPPGPQTIWLGMQRMSDLAWGWEAFGPGSRAGGIAEPGPKGSLEVKHPDAPATKEKDT